MPEVEGASYSSTFSSGAGARTCGVNKKMRVWMVTPGRNNHINDVQMKEKWTSLSPFSWWEPACPMQRQPRSQAQRGGGFCCCWHCCSAAIALRETGGGSRRVGGSDEGRGGSAVAARPQQRPHLLLLGTIAGAAFFCVACVEVLPCPF